MRGNFKRRGNPFSKRIGWIPTGLAVFFLVWAVLTSVLASEFWASKGSDKYHHPDCEWARKISRSNLVAFGSHEEARNAGYVPCRICNSSTAPRAASPPPVGAGPDQARERPRDRIYCTRVVDGDTIVVQIGQKREKVRLIGVDTPETKHPKKPVQRFGKEASLFTKSMVEGEEVRLEFDWQERDKYGRLLAYVYLTDGTFLNAEIIRRGYGFAYTRYPFKYMSQFRQYEGEARKNRKGLWQ